MTSSIFILLFVIISTCYTTATSVEEKKQEYARLLLECAQQHEVSAADVAMLQSKVMPESRAAKCLFACAYKRSGMMDDQGYMSVEGVHQISRGIYADDAARMQRAIEFTEACKSVNYEPVSDGSEGCDRAALIFRCSIEKANQFDLST